ncbi:DUF2267 domain-containing protein [Streptomyces sp. NPDC001985]|uniref:DUF2267 domain-containing protein n=1 Tax=Streptomyces sp. NPDC001985 TaxID=3154406 RepID=UPI0033320C32
MTDDRFIETVRYQGLYPTREEAAYVTRIALRTLARQLSDADRADLAAKLPPGVARHLTARSAAASPLTGQGLVEVMTRSLPRATPANARWGAATVFTLAARLAGTELVFRLIKGLPEGYAPLFGPGYERPVASNSGTPSRI